MKHSESIINISKALTEAQKELKNVSQTANNPFYKSSYAPLNEILAEVRPILNKQGIAILQDINYSEDKMIVSTILLHSSGEWLQQDGMSLPSEKNTAQGAGSAVTYGRRYSLSAFLGIASDEDDDGNNAEKKKTDTKADAIKKNFSGSELNETSPEYMKAKISNVTEYSKNYFKEMKQNLKEIFDFCKKYNFDPIKIDEAIKKL